MSLDDRLRQGLERLDAIESLPSNDLVDSIVLRGRRKRWVRRVVTASVALAAAIAGVVIAPKVLDRSAGETRPALPYGDVGSITTVAGTGVAWTTGDGGRADQAGIEYPIDLDFDGEGNLYILEHGSTPRVRRVDASGQISTVVGPEASGEAAGLDLSDTFSPSGLAVDAEGNVYLGGGEGEDLENRVIRVDPSGDVTIVAGTGQPGVSGDGGPATEARLRRVWDVAVDARGNLYISGQARIRKVDTSGVITTLAGTGEAGFAGDGGPAVAAQLRFVTGIAADKEGNVFFIDYGDERSNDRIRRIDNEGIITTVAGPGSFRGRGECAFLGEGVPAEEAELCGAEHLWVDEQGNVYIADTYNHRIRMIDTNGIIRTVAGSGTDGYSGDGGPALQASLSEPSSVAVGPDGALYIADSDNNRVRRVIL
jgi:sugar lactone lactonase YvrE